jgi:uncharacterized membrane protein
VASTTTLAAETSEEAFAPRMWRPYVACALSLISLGIAGYLTVVHYTPAALVCTANSSFDCAQVVTSPQSVIFGIPVAVLGLLFYVPMFLVNLPVAWRSTWSWVAPLRMALAFVGMGMVLYLISAELLQIHAICLWCTAVHICTFALFVIIVTGWEDATAYRSVPA